MKEDAQIFLQKAEKDLKIAKSLSIENHDFYEGICFHCQQAAEKYLKAYLINNNSELDFTHKINKLLKDCEKLDTDFGELRNININNLTIYAVESRYEEIPEPSLEDVKDAISIAEQTKSFVLNKF